MKRKSKRILSFILALCLILLVGCGSGNENNADNSKVNKEPNVVVGFSQLGAESDWRVANTESIKTVLSRENGYELLFDDGQQKQDKQILAMRKFIQQEVDFIVLAPVTETGWDTVLTEARDANIPVIVVDRKVDVEDGSLYLAWIGSDFRREGDAACQWLREFTLAKGIEPEKVHVVDIQGTIGASAQIGRTDAIEAASREYGWDLVASEPADYTEAKGKEVVSRLLSEHKEINVLYCENDNEALGAVRAVEEAGLTVGTDIANGEIMIISFDATHTGLSMVMEGKIALDVECNPLQGPEIDKIIKTVKEGGTVEKNTFVNEKIFSVDKTVTDITLEDEKINVNLVTNLLLEEREY